MSGTLGNIGIFGYLYTFEIKLVFNAQGRTVRASEYNTKSNYGASGK